ncbi:MAG: DoxX family protein [Candidatus Puniceispirillum sp.]|nr:DoxX family protein [Candidatus Puniceispirillum sp.]
MRAVTFLDKLSFLPVLGMRLWIASVFWRSGLTKISDLERTIALFMDEYHVPLISPEVAAYLSTAVELSMPILLVLGLGARFAALALLFMTGVIEITYMHFDIHIVWSLMLTLILFQGAGKASLDYWIKKKLCEHKCG